MEDDEEPEPELVDPPVEIKGREIKGFEGADEEDDERSTR